MSQSVRGLNYVWDVTYQTRTDRISVEKRVVETMTYSEVFLTNFDVSNTVLSARYIFSIKTKTKEKTEYVITS